MAVPDTTTFSLQDVITELGLSNTSSLRDCFTNAVAGQFDPTYEGSKDRLSNFRNYGAFTPIATDPISLGFSPTNGALACSASTTTYYIPAGETWLTATALYTTSDGSAIATSGFYSNSLFWRQWNGSTFPNTDEC